MTKKHSPSIAAIKREVNGGIREYFQGLADEFGADNFNPDSLSENLAVLFALSAHHSQSDILAAFPSAQDESDIKKMEQEARGWIGNDTHLALTAFGTARKLKISKPDMGYHDADLG